MKPIEALVLMFCAIVGVVLAGRRLQIPYPIALVLGGLCISLIPGLPVIHINPDIVFLVFLPPLLFVAAWFTSWHDFRANLASIFMLAVGLVLFTTVVIGWVVHALIPDIPLAVAFAFGAIVSPPDAVAATAIAEKMGLPKRVVTILEGESLVNDATALVALRFALAGAVSGSFSPGKAAIEFLVVAGGGVAIGLAVAVAAGRLVRLVQEDTLVLTVSLLVPYLAYLPAERLHVSGVLAAVAAGIYGGWKGPEVLSARVRLNGSAVWSMLVFLFNCVLFILIGLELPVAFGSLTEYSGWRLVAYGAIVSGVVILIRPFWVFAASWLSQRWSRRPREGEPAPSWRVLSVISWSGMRGVVSLAAALALPMTLERGQEFPGRGLLIFLTFCVILSTLVCQGLTLPLLIRGLGVGESRNRQEDRAARLKIAQAGLDHLHRVSASRQLDQQVLNRTMEAFQQRVRHLNAELNSTLGWSEDRKRWIAARELWLEALKAQRQELVRQRRAGGIDDSLARQIQRELDVEEAAVRSWAI